MFVLTCHSICSREFTHRVKSVSMAKFTSQEVAALQEGGNQVKYTPPSVLEFHFACQSWLFSTSFYFLSVQGIFILKNGIHNANPPLTAGYTLLISVFHILKLLQFWFWFFAASNVERLRDFIKHVYVDRRYTGERSYGKPPSMKMVRSLSFSPVLIFLDTH